MAKGHYIVMCSYCKKHIKTVETDEERMIGMISHSSCGVCNKIEMDKIKEFKRRRLHD